MAVILDAQALCKNFGAVTAAAEVSAAVEKDSVVGLIGTNGAGKTTFINMSTGYLKPQAGTIEYDGQPIIGLSPRAIVRRGIGRSFQLPQLFTEHTVLENAALAIAAHAGIWSPFTPLLRPRYREEAMALLERFGLSGVANSRADALNEGARKLADIAMAVALQPRLVLMDEPTSGVAAAEKMGIVETLVRVLRDTGVTAVFVEHDMDVVARFADRVAVWSQGRIAALGPPQQVLTDPAVLRDVIGIETAHA
jgi:branched-chain amino acid transport system ATP-binding protein